MRGTPYSNLPVTEIIAKDREFKKHKKTVFCIQPEINKDKQVKDSDERFIAYNSKHQASKSFLENIKSRVYD
jgi:hypothetical protein